MAVTRPENPQLVTERLLVVLPQVDDAGRVAAYYAENRAHLGPWSPPTPDGYDTEPFWRTRIPAVREEARAGSAYRLVLVARNDPPGPVVGTVALSQIARGPFQACYLGYGIDHRFEGMGYMFEALTAVVRWAFDELRLHRVMANYVPTNERSGRLLRRLGFVVEGYARDYLFIDGAWRDHVLTSRTSSTLPRPEL
jgi:ribosomal-protein-alanine N-acetyltransferase